MNRAARYAIGYISGEVLTARFAHAMLEVVSRDDPPIFSLITGPVMHTARNELVNLYLNLMEAHSHRLVIIDSDIEFSLDDLDALLEHDEDVVSGIYSDAVGGIVRTGCGFMSIRREVLENLAPHAFTPYVLPDGRVSGEDVGFLHNARQAGFETVLDEQIRVGHVKHQVLHVMADATDKVEVLVL